jgi:uncharacterized lipoprotein YehR (DUF1307 family)
MKNLFKVFGIIAFVAIIGFSMVACDDGSEEGNNIPASLIGTYGYTPTGSLTITFKADGTFAATQSSGPVIGTYTVSGSSITLSERYYGLIWTIIDSTTVQDESGDNWKKR